MVSALDLISKLAGWVVLLRILSPFVFFWGGAAIGFVECVGRAGAASAAGLPSLWAVVLAASFLVILWVRCPRAT